MNVEDDRWKDKELPWESMGRESTQEQGCDL